MKTDSNLAVREPGKLALEATRWNELRWLTLSALLAFLGALGNLAAAEPAAGGAPKRLQVLTSFLPIYCFTANIAGDLAQVANLLPANVGPHDYQPTPSDEKKLRTADLLVLNGLQLESWHEKLVRSRVRRKQLTVVEVWKGLNSELIRSVPTLHIVDGGDSHAHDHAGDANPHLWLDPLLAKYAVTNILRALQQADPANASGYAANADGFSRRLDAIHRDYATGLMAASNAPVVVFHDAFVYAAKRYGLRIVGVIEQTPEVTPSPRYLGELKRVIEQQRIRVIFAEPQFPAKLARQLAQDTGVPLAVLDTMETAFDGVLKPDSYERAMAQNLRVLQEHLK
ncbi:MAG: zinc ABC transporter substrate-binding protein [Verrucomicrobiales bacterium]|nr:zinc ABC transporter substrate-binding protein [Verrucomicrobiales bacterium]